MRLSRCTTPVVAFLLSTAAGAQSPASPMPQGVADPQIAAALQQISAAKVQADIAKLVSFGTRSTLSSMDTDLPAGHGISAAADWVESEFQAISAGCGGCLEVKRDVFNEEPAAEGKPKNRFACETKLSECICGDARVWFRRCNSREGCAVGAGDRAYGLARERCDGLACGCAGSE